MIQPLSSRWSTAGTSTRRKLVLVGEWDSISYLVDTFVPALAVLAGWNMDVLFATQLSAPS